jgi:cell division septum initiation protein DivIVA
VKHEVINMNEDEEYEMIKLGAEVIKERLDKIEPLEERIDSMANILAAVLKSLDVIAQQNIELAELCASTNENIVVRIATIEARLHSNDLKMCRVVKSMCIMMGRMRALRATLPDEEDVIEDILASLEDAGDDIVHEDWW